MDNKQNDIKSYNEWTCDTCNKIMTLKNKTNHCRSNYHQRAYKDSKKSDQEKDKFYREKLFKLIELYAPKFKFPIETANDMFRMLKHTIKNSYVNVYTIGASDDCKLDEETCPKDCTTCNQDESDDCYKDQI